MSDSAINPRWLKVLECGHTSTVGMVVTIKAHYYTPRGIVNYGCCYIEDNGHFNLFLRMGHAREIDFPIGKQFRVMRVAEERYGDETYTSTMAWLAPAYPDVVVLPEGI